MGYKSVADTMGLSSFV